MTGLQAVNKEQNIKKKSYMKSKPEYQEQSVET